LTDGGRGDWEGRGGDAAQKWAAELRNKERPYIRHQTSDMGRKKEREGEGGGGGEPAPSRALGPKSISNSSAADTAKTNEKAPSPSGKKEEANSVIPIEEEKEGD